MLVVAVCIPSLGKKSKAQLEKEQKKIKKELKEAEKILGSTLKAKKVSLAQLRAINNQIRQRKKYLSSIQEEVDYYNTQIIQSSDIILGMENDLTQLKEDYGQMIYQASKTNTSFEKLAFVFSAKSINQLQLRLKYISMYNASRKKQVKIISEVRDMLMMEQSDLISKKDEKKRLLDELTEEEIKLESAKIEQSRLFKNLASEEKQLRSKIKKYKKQQKEIDDLIAALVRESLTKKDGLPQVEIDKLNKDFASNKGRLPWPTDRGFVSHGFGRQPHPVFGDKAMMEYKGIGVQTNPKQKVKTIFGGEVRMVASIPGSGKLVMIGHGDYISVYNKLESTYVSKGDFIKAGDEIGVVNTNGDGETELDFQLWKGKTPIDPETWLKKK